MNAHGQSGIIVEIQNEKALGEALERVGTEEVLYQTLKEGAKRRFNENFTQQNMVEKAIMFYESLI